jgi:hypothetical protein
MRVNLQGEEVLDPFRKSMSNALQWYECVLRRVKEKVEAIIEATEPFSIEPSTPEKSASSVIPSSESKPFGPPPPPNVRESKELTLQQTCARFLRELCPACFASAVFGRSFSRYVHS